MQEFSNLVIGSIAVIPLVMGLVQLVKLLFKVEGNWNIVTALVFGLLFGGLAYGTDQQLLPAAWVPFIQWAVFALAVGLGAAGLYNVGKTSFGTRKPEN